MIRAFFCAVFVTAAGCARRGVVSLPSESRSIETGVPDKGFEDLSPRAQASLRLTGQAKALLEEGRTSDAIMTLERAINLNPANGLNYYYMAEAWLDNGAFREAMKYNELARSGLEGVPYWMDRVEEQRQRIKTRAY